MENLSIECLLNAVCGLATRVCPLCASAKRSLNVSQIDFFPSYETAENRQEIPLSQVYSGKSTLLNHPRDSCYQLHSF